MSDSYLQSVLLGACPELRASWEAHRRTFTGTGAPDDQALLDAVRRHVVGLLATGHAAEFSRFTRVIERLLGEADPILHELLLDGLLRPLARDIRDAGINESRVAHHLGSRTTLAWREA